MSDAWKSYPGAPGEGARVCPLGDVPDGNTLCLEIDGFPVVLLRLSETLRAFVNACPHQYLPLNHKGENLISSDRTVLRCTNHHAGFSVLTGAGVEGLGIGACLDPVPVTTSEGWVLIGSIP